MGDREYLYELALILDSAEGHTEEEVTFIRIESNTSTDIAEKLRHIAYRMSNTVN